MGDEQAGRDATTRGLLRAVVDYGDVATIAYDTELRVTEWSAATARNTGIARADALGRSVLDLFPYVRGTAVEEEYRRSLAGETVDGRERAWTPTSAGRPRYFDLTYLPVRDDDGVIIGGAVVTRDVTARRETEESLAEERRLLRTILDSAPYSLVAVDTELRIVEWNAYSERHSAVRRADVVGRPLLDVLPELEATDILDDYRAAVAGHTRLVRGRWYRPPSAPPRCFDVVFAPMHDGRGATTGAVMTAYDVTDRERAEAERSRLVAELDGARKRAERASQAKSAMLAGLSHELRTPLGAVIGFAQILRDDASRLTRQQADYVDDVLEGASHLLRVVNDALDLARVEAGAIELLPVDLDLRAIVAQVVSAMAGSAATAGIALGTRVDEDARWLIADGGRVRQVLLNYLSNAVKYGTPGTRVDVEVRSEGPDAVRLTVRDTGPGIAPADVGRLFVEFQRLGTDRDVPGSGLGLAITKRLVEAMGGTVAAESTVGAGSAFHAILPRHPAA